MALRLKRGELSKPSKTVKQMAKMKTESLRDFAKKPGPHSKPLRYHKRKD